MEDLCTLDPAELLPHAQPMILIDRLVSFDAAAETLAAEVTIGPNQVFHAGTGVPSHVAIEYMAQTAAALAGLQDRQAKRAPRPGFLLGTRKLTLDLPQFEDGQNYRITATCAFADAESAAFACAIADADGKTVATATLTTYRPPNPLHGVPAHLAL